MKRFFALFSMVLLAVFTTAKAQNRVFIYSPDERSGLHVALQTAHQWQHLGQLCSSDYGTWGAEKRMYHTSLCRAADGSWRLVFQVNDHSPVFAAAYSSDLVTWRPQDYPHMPTRQCLAPVVHPAAGGFEVVFKADGHYYRTLATADFRHFSAGERLEGYVPAATDSLERISIGGKLFSGHLFTLSDEEVALVRRSFDAKDEDARKSSERMHDDATQLAWLTKPVDATLSIDLQHEKAISDQLIGVFFEDISYAADGGLYAELIQNRDFEYSRKDRREWSATTAWHAAKPIEIDTRQPLHPNNPHYALLTQDTLWNEGYDGISIEKGKKYDFSMFVLGKGQQQTFDILLVGADGSLLASTRLKTAANDWQPYSAVLKATKTDAKARLAIIPQKAVRVGIDMVSLFPQETFMNRKNGLRKDLAEVIAALKPKFVRFPGGCMSHGQGLDNIYHWNHTIGPLQERKPDMNIWHYHQTRGLGFYEYFQFCEDIGAEPLPVLAAGVPCQNSANNSEGFGGQQGGIPMSQMPAYIDELCNLIDWANADPATNEWAAKRAEAGHPEPFNLKYLGIGNEDIISTVFEERYTMICKALRERHPEIKVCGTVGPFHTPSADYIEGWDLCQRHPELQYMTDEHYYESTGWFMHHRDYYDRYDRQGTKVYLGEWAASTRVKRPNVETALAEALYLTDVERNGDVVVMTSYAPMLCKDGHSNWNPDMIYFSNTSVRTTPAYEVQRLFSVYCGDRYVRSELTVHSPESSVNPESSSVQGSESSVNSESSVQSPQPSVESRELSHRVGASVVRDSKTGKRYVKLVNALPVPLRISVEGVQLPATVRCEQFTGAIDDQKAKAVVIETTSPTTLPPYSIRVFEL